MKKVNMIGINLLVLILLTPAMGLLAQSTAITLPVFALSIEEKPLEAENTQGTHVLLVKYTNTSQTEQKDGCMVTPGAYKVIVFRDGIAVEKRKPKCVPKAARLALNLHQIGGSNLVAVVRGIGAGVASSYRCFNLPTLGRGMSQQRAAALVGVRFFAMCADRRVNRRGQPYRQPYSYVFGERGAGFRL